MMNHAAVPSLTIGIPCRVNEPRLDVTLESLLVACRHLALPTTLGIEIVICINGWQGEEECPPLAAALQVSERAAIPLRQYDSTATRPPDDSPPLSISVLCCRRLGKAIAWNAIRRWTASDLVIFCDADVRVSAEAVAALYTTLQSSPEARLVASNQIPAVTAQDTWLRHAAALPYRFYFHNVTGPLYIMRRDALKGEMPEGLLFEDAWLTLAVGRRWITQAPHAYVFFLPPSTWRDWYAERVRTEAGKLQIQRGYPHLLDDGPAAVYPWQDFVRGLRLRDIPLLCLLIGVRFSARMRARRVFQEGKEQQLWRVVESSKEWETPR